MGRKNAIVVGIDFGTTYSGIAWALRGGGDVEVISTWPGGGSRTTPKAPSTILYKNNVIQWGYQTEDLGDTIQGVKLLLDESHKPKYQPTAEVCELIKKKDTTPVRVASDYLRKLVAHVKDTLDRRFGSGVQSLTLEYVLTVPAVWSDAAKSASVFAAEEAGIPVQYLTLVSEPEAAALHCLRSIQPNTVQKGDVVVVCDAGGGTVDLISYCVISTDPLRLKEGTQGTGGVCGSACLDGRFKEYLKKRFGKKFEKIPRQSKQMAMKYWAESIKPNFTGHVNYPCSEKGKLERDYFVPIPGTSDKWAKGLENGFLAVSTDAIKDIFDPVVREVEGLVDHQMDGLSKIKKPPPKALLLVGGFGSSEYLFQRLKTRYSNVDILQPSNAWSAVVQGAVQYGLCGNQVQKRIARRNYGINIVRTFGSKKPQGSGTYWCELEEQWKMRDCMEWYIRKGDVILEDRPIKMPWCTIYAADNIKSKPKGLLASRPLYVCDNDKPPQKVTNDTLTTCSMSHDLRDIPAELFEKRTNSKGTEYYIVHYDVQMTPKSASILLELVRDGKTYGTVDASYEV